MRVPVERRELLLDEFELNFEKQFISNHVHSNTPNTSFKPPKPSITRSYARCASVHGRISAWIRIIRRIRRVWQQGRR